MRQYLGLQPFSKPYLGSPTFSGNGWRSKDGFPETQTQLGFGCPETKPRASGDLGSTPFSPKINKRKRNKPK